MDGGYLKTNIEKSIPESIKLLGGMGTELITNYNRNDNNELPKTT
jgi:hypothetical protein